MPMSPECGRSLCFDVGVLLHPHPFPPGPRNIFFSIFRMDGLSIFIGCQMGTKFCF